MYDARMTEAVVTAVESAVAPAVQVVLADLKTYAGAELAHLEQSLPGLLANADQDAKDAVGAILVRWHGLLGRIEQHLSGVVPTPPSPATQPATPS
jgi:predicted trehalose synthase